MAKAKQELITIPDKQRAIKATSIEFGILEERKILDIEEGITLIEQKYIPLGKPRDLSWNIKEDR